MLLLMTRDYVGDVSCKAPWQTFTAFEAGSALPQRPRNVPAAGRWLANGRSRTRTKGQSAIAANRAMPIFRTPFR